MALSFVAMVLALATGEAVSVPSVQATSQDKIVSFHMVYTSVAFVPYEGPRWYNDYATDVKDARLEPTATLKMCHHCEQAAHPANFTVAEENGSLIFRIPHAHFDTWDYGFLQTCRLGQRDHTSLPPTDNSWYSAHKDWTICKVADVAGVAEQVYYLFIANVSITPAPPVPPLPKGTKMVSFHQVYTSVAFVPYEGPIWYNDYATDVKDAILNPIATLKVCHHCKQAAHPANFTVAEESGSLTFRIPHAHFDTWDYGFLQTCKLGQRDQTALPPTRNSWYSAHNDWTICKVADVAGVAEQVYYLFIANVTIRETLSEILV